MIKLINILQEVLNQQQIVDVAKEFMNSESYNSNHDCKRSTFEFIKWVKKNKEFEPIALLLAPPKDIKKYPGKSETGDSHIFSIIDGYGVDFTADQFPGVSEPLKITLEDQIPSEYEKIGGYYTLFPDWFPEETNGGKTFIKTTWGNLPQWFRDGKPDLNESVDKTAGVWDTNEKFKDGSDFKIKFKVSDIIDLAKNTPVKEIDPKSIKYNFSGRQDSDPSKTKERVMKADLSYPIIVVKNKAGKIFAMLDGTHRLEKALNLGLDKIKTKILDKEDLIQFKTNKLKENIKLTDILVEILSEAELNQCPTPTQNIELNLQNRQKAINEYGYGPLNPSKPNDKFWQAKVDMWKLDSVKEAKSSRCGNCAAFDQTTKTLDCIAKGIGDDGGSENPFDVIKAGNLGYCRFLKFKCAAARTCDAWVVGGPLTK